MQHGAAVQDSGRFTAAEAALHDAAVVAAGADDFGDPSYLDGFRVVLDAYDRDARFHPAGRQAARANLVQLLTTRLRAQKLLKQHAAALRPPHRPIIVLGLVRTGSTALHHLLAQDPEVQTLEYWLAAHPQPRPPRSTWETLADFQESAAEIEGMYAFDPSLRGIHLMAPDLAEECRHLLAQSFADDSFEVNATVPTYTRWYETAPHRGTYARHRQLIGLIGATAPPERRWILKYPVHMKHLGTLLETYPDACIVQTHRDPSRVLSSYVHLIAAFRAIFEADIDPAAIAREQLEVWAAGAERAIAVRRQHDPAQFLDLHFHDFVADPIGAVRRIYERFGLVLSSEAEGRMRQWQAHTPEGRQGGERAGEAIMELSRDAILDRFAPYMRHFDLHAE